MALVPGCRNEAAPAQATPGNATGSGSRALRLLKDHGLVAIQQDAIFHVPAYGPRQHHFFNVAALLDQVVDSVAMVDGDDTLLDDGTVVEYLGNVVRGGADELDATLKRLMVGFGADERW